MSYHLKSVPWSFLHDIEEMFVRVKFSWGEIIPALPPALPLPNPLYANAFTPIFQFEMICFSYLILVRKHIGGRRGKKTEKINWTKGRLKEGEGKTIMKTSLQIDFTGKYRYNTYISQLRIIFWQRTKYAFLLKLKRINRE